jgi:hypothetical protein
LSEVIKDVEDSEAEDLEDDEGGDADEKDAKVDAEEEVMSEVEGARVARLETEGDGVAAMLLPIDPNKFRTLNDDFRPDVVLPGLSPMVMDIRIIN